MQSRSFTRYSVEAGRRERHRERWTLCVEWGLIAGACVVIVVFAYLLLTCGLV